MSGVQSEEIQRIQASRMIEHHRYLISRYAGECRTALDIGCGRGHVMSRLQDLLDIKGADNDIDEVEIGRNRGLDIRRADGLNLPFPDRSFDLVISSFYLMWTDDIDSAIREANRVAARKVIFLAEPVWSMGVFDPPELGVVINSAMERIMREGGDHDSGRSMLYSLRRSGMDHRYGIIPVDTSPGEVLSAVVSESEWAGVEIPTPEPVLFHIPFVWAVIEIS